METHLGVDMEDIFVANHGLRGRHVHEPFHVLAVVSELAGHSTEARRQRGRAHAYPCRSVLSSRLTTPSVFGPKISVPRVSQVSARPFSSA